MQIPPSWRWYLMLRERAWSAEDMESRLRGSRRMLMTRRLLQGSAGHKDAFSRRRMPSTGM